MRISDWSSDVCSSDLHLIGKIHPKKSTNFKILVADPDSARYSIILHKVSQSLSRRTQNVCRPENRFQSRPRPRQDARSRSEEHTSELQSLMRTSYPDFCLKQIIKYTHRHLTTTS